MDKLVKVINNKDRYFNGARKGQILSIDKNRVNYYLQNGFSLVKEIEEKKNIVKETGTFEGVDDNLTVAQLKEKLDHYGIDYSECNRKADYQKLLSEALKKSTKDDDNNSDTETLKKQLIDDAIVEASELEGKTDAEIIQIATDNGLI